LRALSKSPQAISHLARAFIPLTCHRMFCPESKK
jgi:hypothetical protein